MVKVVYVRILLNATVFTSIITIIRVFTWLQLMFDDALWGDTAHNLHGDLRYMTWFAGYTFEQ
jgi:hypothetical protein